MERRQAKPREGWEKTVESQGLSFHSIDDVTYWDESAHYVFTRSEIDAIEAATYALNEMCLAAVQHVIDAGRFEEFQIPPAYVEMVKRSWDRDEFTLYGRFDLALDERGGIKLLEYNADTPTSLLEAAVIQWFWMKDLYPRADQFNSIHERLIEAWKRYRPQVAGTMYFAALAECPEDIATVTYLRDTAMQAGLTTGQLTIQEIGWHEGRGEFTDLRERRIEDIFKLYAWEWMIREQFGPKLLQAPVRWLEAPWKMILSNKAILPVLYELFPDSPYLLPAAWEPLSGDHVRKPRLSREGANVTFVEAGAVTLETEGEYGGPWIYQELCPIRAFDGNHPVIGSWMVNGYACGIGIREDTCRVTGNTSRFVPHLFR